MNDDVMNHYRNSTSEVNNILLKVYLKIRLKSIEKIFKFYMIYEEELINCLAPNKTYR